MILVGAYKTRWYRNTGPGGKILRRVAWRIPEVAILVHMAALVDRDIQQQARLKDPGSVPVALPQ